MSNSFNGFTYVNPLSISKIMWLAALMWNNVETVYLTHSLTHAHFPLALLCPCGVLKTSFLSVSILNGPVPLQSTPHRTQQSLMLASLALGVLGPINASSGPRTICCECPWSYNKLAYIQTGSPAISGTRKAQKRIFVNVARGKNRLRGSKPSAFTWKTSILWYSRTTGTIYARSKINFILAKGNIIVALRRKPDAMALLQNVKKFS